MFTRTLWRKRGIAPFLCWQRRKESTGKPSDVSRFSSGWAHDETRTQTSWPWCCFHPECREWQQLRRPPEVFILPKKKKPQRLLKSILQYHLRALMTSEWIRCFNSLGKLVRYRYLIVTPQRSKILVCLLVRFSKETKLIRYRCRER